MLTNLVGALQRTPIYAEGVARALNVALSRTPSLMLSITAEVFDFLSVQVAAITANSALQHGSGMSLVGIFGANAVGLACYFSFHRGGLYELGVLRNTAQTIRAIFARWSVLCLLLAISAALLHHNGERARIWSILFYVVGFFGFCLTRFIVAAWVRCWLAQGNYTHAVSIIGDGDSAKKLAEILNTNKVGLKFVGLFSGDQLSNPGYRPGIIELLDLAGRDEVDTVIIAEPVMQADQLRCLIQKLRQQPLSIYLMPNPIALETTEYWRRDGRGFPWHNLFPLANTPINEMSLLIKTLFDRLSALLLLTILSPIMLACALGIRLSGPGPILFRQKRIGYKGRDFTIFKFRTMYVSECPNVKLTLRNDPRVFQFGLFLRKTSLDELPQLFNVLRGDMSLVGPRPHMPQAMAAGCLYFEAVSDYAARHRVKPGITGWAQVNGWRGPTETVDQIKARVAHDLYYIENWSLLFDFSIIARTFLVLFGKNVF